MKNCSKRYLEKISKCHFIIEREPLEDTGKNSKNMNPAYITCYGRNGIYVNNDKMTPEARRILSENDVIKLTKNLKLFEFNYTDWNPMFKELLPETCIQKYYVGREIGSGGCGVVRLCYNVNTFHKYAMKIIVKQKNSLSSSVVASDGSIDNEVKIMKSVLHPNVLSLTDFYESQNSAVIIMDYLEGGDMLNRITQYNPNMKRLSEEDSKFYFLQACHGLKYLHDHSITHRDIKPDNILLQSSERDTMLKISDFGLSKLVALGPMKTVCGTQVGFETIFGFVLFY